MVDLCHYTMNTKHLRPSPASEVAPEALELCRRFSRHGKHLLPPPFAGYELDVIVPERGVLFCSVCRLRDQARLVDLTVAVDDAALQRARKWLAIDGVIWPEVLYAPACVVDLKPALAADLDAAAWLGDLDRCLAWAFIVGASQC